MGESEPEESVDEDIKKSFLLIIKVSIFIIDLLILPIILNS